MDTGPAGRRSMQSGRPVSDAGGTTGCSTSMCGATLTASIGSCSSKQSATYGLPVGASLHRALAEGSGHKWRTVASCRVRQERRRVGS